MRSLLNALPTPTPIDFRRFARELHGFAKQAQFETPSVRVPNWFWRDSGRFLEVQMGVKIYFWEVFRDALTERFVELIFVNFNTSSIIISVSGLGIKTFLLTENLFFQNSFSSNI